MKKHILLLLLASAASVKGMAYPRPDQFKQLVTTLRSSGTVGDKIHHGLLDAYGQVLAILKATEKLCADAPKTVAAVESSFAVSAKSFVDMLEARMPQFQRMNAEHLVSPLLAVLHRVLTPGGDFKAKVVQAIQELEKYAGVIA